MELGSAVGAAASSLSRSLSVPAGKCEGNTKFQAQVQVRFANTAR